MQGRYQRLDVARALPGPSPSPRWQRRVPSSFAVNSSYIFLRANKKAELLRVTFTLATVGSPAFLESLYRTRDFPPHPYEWFGFSRCLLVVSIVQKPINKISNLVRIW
jgi:hypothetical protein